MYLAHFIGIGFGRQATPDIFIEGDTTPAYFSTDTTIEKQSFVTVEALG